MTPKLKKYLIYFFWLVILLIGPITVFSNTSLEDALSDPELLINLFQRITGLAAFSLLFVQILLGSYLTLFLKYLGAKGYRFHILQGITIYALLLTHPLLYVLYNYQTLGVITLFLWPYLDINSPLYELYLTYGRLAFVMLTVGVFAGYFRKHPKLRVHWRKFHILNYFSFFFVALHAFNVGTDVRSFPFVIFYGLAVLFIASVVIKRFIYKLDFILPKPNTDKNELPSKSN